MSEEVRNSDTTEYQENQTITKRDVYKVGLRWMFSNTSAFNWERMQNVAFAWSMVPILKKVTHTKKELGEALKRHMVFFNTQPSLGSLLVGAVAAMEVQKAHGEDIPDDLFNAIKTGLMGPIAAIGDSLFGSTGNALLLSFGMGLALTGNVLGPIIFALGWMALTIVINMWGVQFGFKEGTNVISSSLFSPETVDKATSILSILGLTVVGGLSASFVKIATPIQWGTGKSITTLQSVLNNLMPGILPFAYVLLLWYLHDKKKISILKLLLLTIIIAAIGSLIHLFE
ncbi:PTS system mannose/fructose/sorbose family transporter subunit IID [Sporolactobacillus sp. CQH2019]|uniref:PTS system mannose/fructose/sorbose family transporter subunit IID n=1 Tax=Sporolactobacillus sp. CQH2019 TaxID=3023512 RepID=UPI0023675915|nr:PTS system mannose/fructose/sorbose family transporter subunit IID [Sporolactobacillus sp. CQH2019]MDD9150277.1 PTS system mannose/fructose/sorbose family transporter subunit IID [Sporolactobacillus sp. CQH2019]